MSLGPFGIFTIGALLVVFGWVIHRRRLQRYTGSDRDRLDDDLVRRIEQTGRVELDDPLDHDEVREEEERFWDESWDRPEAP